MHDFKPFETIQDLLSDESFLKFCSGNDEKAAEFWKAWIMQSPEKKELAIQAKQILIASLVEMEDEHSSLEALRAGLLENTNYPSGSADRLEEEQERGKNRSLYLILSAAACIILLFTFISILRPSKHGENYLYIHADTVLHAYLPDSTLMVLNKGTSVHYPQDFNRKGLVFIDEGEVFFKVNESGGTSLTIVTATGLKVEDIGTEFSVKSYEKLKEEAVQVQQGIVEVYNEHARPVRLVENQALRVDKISGSHTFSKADRLSTSGWVNGEIALYDVRFDEVAVTLSDVFNKKVKIAGPGLAGRRVTILFKRDQKLEDIVETLSVIYNLNVSYENESITIAQKSEDNKQKDR